jgi:hypothetical protein
MLRDAWQVEPGVSGHPLSIGPEAVAR